MDSAAAPVMVKASVLSEKLRAALGDGVDSALLLTTSGALLCTASNRTDFARSQECRMLAALVANIWRNYAQSQAGMPMDVSGSSPHGGGGGSMMGGVAGSFDAAGPHQGAMGMMGGGGHGGGVGGSHHHQQQGGNAVGGGGGGRAQSTDLELVLAELETNKLCCFGLGGRAVLALFAASATELGLLKLKAASLQAELYDGLRIALRNGDALLGPSSAANSPSGKSERDH